MLSMQRKAMDGFRKRLLRCAFRSRLIARFQIRLAEQVLAKWTGDRDRRLEWAVTPPEEFARVVSRLPPSIDVPPDPGAASIALAALYTSGKDGVISASFGAFAAVLRDRDEALFPAYMAEINRGLNSVEIRRGPSGGGSLGDRAASNERRNRTEFTRLLHRECLARSGDYTKAVEVYRAACPIAGDRCWNSRQVRQESEAPLSNLVTKRKLAMI